MSLENDVTQVMAQLHEGYADAKRTFVDLGKIAEDAFEQLSEKDPTSQKKYLVWMCRQYITTPELGKFDIIRQFHDLAFRGIIKNSDIYSYKSIQDVEKAVEDSQGIFTGSSLRKGSKEIGKIPADIVRLDNDKVVIIEPRDKNEAIYYGRGSKWCTAAMGRGNLFSNYHTANKRLYYILAKNPTNEESDKFAVSYRLLSPRVFGHEDPSSTPRYEWILWTKEDRGYYRNDRGVDTILSQLGLSASDLAGMFDKYAPKEFTIGEANVVYDSPKIKIYYIDDVDTAIELGKGTEWFVAAPSDNQFGNYYGMSGYNIYYWFSKIDDHKYLMLQPPADGGSKVTLWDERMIPANFKKMAAKYGVPA